VPHGVTNQKLLAKRMLLEKVACPHCGAAAYERCKEPSGKVAGWPHAARRSAAADAKLYTP
jgi:hypothetical protein